MFLALILIFVYIISCNDHPTNQILTIVASITAPFLAEIHCDCKVTNATCCFLGLHVEYLISPLLVILFRNNLNSQYSTVMTFCSDTKCPLVMACFSEDFTYVMKYDSHVICFARYLIN